MWDHLRSEVNAYSHQGERIVLPHLQVAVTDLVSMTRQGRVTLFGTDISDAFHQIPLDPAERKFTATSFAGKFYLFRVLVFGATSAPTVWGRYAAFIGRSSAAILDGPGARLHVYVDDPLYAIRGTEEEAVHTATIATMWLGVVGLPLAWHKTEAGPRLQWIGATIELHPDHVRISVLADKISAVKDDLASLQEAVTAPRRRFRQLAGRINFVTGLVPPPPPSPAPPVGGWSQVSEP